METLQQFLRKPLSGPQYAAWGFSLMAVKYMVEFLLIYLTNGTVYSLWAFTLPLSQPRVEAIGSAPQWVSWFILIWSLPFLFLAITLSIRRSVDAFGSPWPAMWILCPLVNLFFMVGFCFAPRSEDAAIQTATKGLLKHKIQPQEAEEEPTVKEPTHSTPISPSPIDDVTARDQSDPAADAATLVLLSIGTMLAGLAITIAVLLGSIYFLKDYGASIFFSSPVLLGVICGYVQTRHSAASGVLPALFVSCGAVVLGCGVLIALAFEGVVCIVMALPIMLPAAMVGGLIGYLIAVSTHAKGPSWVGLLLLLPSSVAIEHVVTEPTVFEVVSVVEVAAPIDEVWKQVVAFPEITDPPGLMFQLGVAYPVKARIEGTGVGAVRYCEFSTGDFVEPITVWDRPRHLAFSVEDQPCPLTELSPYEAIHPPHLDGFLRSHGGEFRLVELPDGRTQLEGHTWYSVDMYPQLYWKVWTDSIIHAIHYRVLDHIRVVSESKGTCKS